MPRVQRYGAPAAVAANAAADSPSSSLLSSSSSVAVRIAPLPSTVSNPDQFPDPAPVNAGGSKSAHLDTLAVYACDADSDNFHADIVKIPPLHFCWAVNRNTSVTRVIEGPCRFTALDDERVVYGPEKMIVVPANHYVVVDNPVARGADGRPLVDEHGQVRLRHSEQEIRFEQKDPFPLYPGEALNGDIQALRVVPRDQALRLSCLRDFTDRFATDAGGRPIVRVAGDLYLFEGPALYRPQLELRVVEVVEAVIIQPDHALRLRALRDTVDRAGKERKQQEEWLVRNVGTYMPGAYEYVVGVASAHVLTPTTALHLRARSEFVDRSGKLRKAGTEWLVTLSDTTTTYIVDVLEEEVGVERKVFVNKTQYCVILNPIDDATGLPQIGLRRLVRGEAAFFLQPGEALEGQMVRSVDVLRASEAMLVRATIDHRETKTGRSRRAGEEWLIYGPCEFVPALEVAAVGRRQALINQPSLGLFVFDLTLPVLLVVVSLLVFLVFKRWSAATAL